VGSLCFETAAYFVRCFTFLTSFLLGVSSCLAKRLPPPSPSTASEKAKGRENNGRFATGNTGGPGNPFARQVAALRKALINTVTEKDIADIIRRLIASAVSGDVAAARLVLSYAIGKPTPAHNPDQMNISELQQAQAEGAMFTEMMKFSKTPELEMPLLGMRLSRWATAENYSNIMRQGLRAMDERDKQREQQQAKAARSTNGSNGDSEQPGSGGMLTQRVGMSETEDSPMIQPKGQGLDHAHAAHGHATQNGNATQNVHAGKSKNERKGKDANPSPNGSNGALKEPPTE
jgi:hypothetical protein